MDRDFIIRLAGCDQGVALAIVRRNALTLAELELFDRLMRVHAEYREPLQKSIEAAMARAKGVQPRRRP